jgi:hypothetical protein
MDLSPLLRAREFAGSSSSHGRAPVFFHHCEETERERSRKRLAAAIASSRRQEGDERI